MRARALTKSDYDRIVSVIDQWWEGPTTALAHPIFFYELGQLAQVVEWEDGNMVGFLFGFVVESYSSGLPPSYFEPQVTIEENVPTLDQPSNGAATEVAFDLSNAGSPPLEDGARIGYIHLIGIDPDYRRRGVARALYAAFEEACVNAGCAAIKAIAPHGNDGSIRFHIALGFMARTVDDYAGPGRSRMVFLKRLRSP